MNISQVVSELEAAGAALRLDGENVRIWYPDEDLRWKLAGHVTSLRQHRSEVVGLLKVRNCDPRIPAGVRLVEWALKEPPVLVECSAVVIAGFAPARQGHIGQLRMAGVAVFMIGRVSPRRTCSLLEKAVSPGKDSPNQGPLAGANELIKAIFEKQGH